MNDEQFKEYTIKKEKIMKILKENNYTYLDGNCVLKLCQMELDITLIKSNNIFVEKEK